MQRRLYQPHAQGMVLAKPEHLFYIDVLTEINASQVFICLC